MCPGPGFVTAGAAECGQEDSEAQRSWRVRPVIQNWLSSGAVWRYEWGMAKFKKNAAAVALGRLGGLKGGKARARKLTPKQRRESARKAARARWAREK
jgi:hypothetical protein